MHNKVPAWTFVMTGAFRHAWCFSAHLVAACRKVTKKPLITKLSSSSNRLKEGVRRCIEAGSDAFAVTNTIPGMAVDIRKKKPVLASVQGGLSGGRHQANSVARSENSL